jgi:hypothetical protein
MWTSRTSLAGLMLALLAPAWAGGPPQSTTSAAARSSDKAAVAGPLRFIADDAPAALAEAKRRGVPIFVEAWAPW